MTSSDCAEELAIVDDPRLKKAQKVCVIAGAAVFLMELCVIGAMSGSRRYMDWYPTLTFGEGVVLTGIFYAYSLYKRHIKKANLAKKPNNSARANRWN